MSASETSIARGRARVGSKVGLHARPAAIVAGAAAETGAILRIGRADAPGVDARSPLLLLSLGVGFGEEVVVEAEGDGAEAAVQRIVALLEQDHDA